MTYEDALAFTRRYQKLLRQLKQAQLKVEHMPDDTAKAALALHQHALVCFEVIRQHKRKEPDRSQ